MFDQTFQSGDLLVVLLLVVLEGVLSIDNALVLGLLAGRLQTKLQKKALTYGLVGALVFRLVSIGLASQLLRWQIVKLLGGAYLIYISVKHLWLQPNPKGQRICTDANGRPIAVDEETGKPLTDAELGEEIFRQTHGVGIDYEAIDSVRTLRFWEAVAVIELTDLAFAIDSILAAIALVGAPPRGWPPGKMHPKLWVIVLGGMLGVILMRFAAMVFIRLLEKFPRFELTAYLLVLLIGLKLIADWWFNVHGDRLNFQDAGSPGFWIFWILTLACFVIGFLPQRGRKPNMKENVCD